MTDIRIGSALTDNGNPIAAHGKRSVREALLRQFVEKIVSGEFAENATLPNEAELTQQLGVSRTSLRETMQYLSALGMIRSRTRAGTTVLPRENWNYLDPLVLDAVLKFGTDERFYVSLIEARQLLEPAAAALAAAHAGARDLLHISNALEEMVEANSRDNEAWSRADLDFHTAIINASGNWVYTSNADYNGPDAPDGPAEPVPWVPTTMALLSLRVFVLTSFVRGRGESAMIRV